MVDQTLHFLSKKWWKCEILSYKWVIYLKRKLSSCIIHFQVEKIGFLKKKIFFRIFNFLHRRVPPLDIFGDLRYFQKKFENLKNSLSRTSLTWNGTKSWILVTLAHLARKWQTGLWRPGQICPPLFQIGLIKGPLFPEMVPLN